MSVDNWMSREGEDDRRSPLQISLLRYSLLPASENHQRALRPVGLSIHNSIFEEGKYVQPCLPSASRFYSGPPETGNCVWTPNYFPDSSRHLIEVHNKLLGTTSSRILPPNHLTTPSLSAGSTIESTDASCYKPSTPSGSLHDSEFDVSSPFSPERTKRTERANKIKRAPKHEISKRNESVLKNAFAHHPNPSRLQKAFLSACMGITAESIDNWQRHNPVKLSLEEAEPQLHPCRPVAVWRHDIIERGLLSRKTTSWDGHTLFTLLPPTNDEIRILADGLRLQVDIVQGIVKVYTIKGLEPALFSPSWTPKRDIASSPKIQLKHAQFDSDEDREDLVNAAFQLVRGRQDPILEELDLMMHRNIANCPVSRSEANDEVEVTLEGHIAGILGPEYAQIASTLASICPASPQEVFSSFGDSPIDNSEATSPHYPSPTWYYPHDTPSSTSQASGVSGSGSTPPLSTTSSPTSGDDQKRESPGDGGSDGVGSGNSRDGKDGSDRPSKRKKTTQAQVRHRFDCPVARTAIHIGGTDTASTSSRGCAPGGLEFRNVWDHITKAHFGCQICGKKLNSHDDATNHLLDKDTDPESCRPNLTGRRYEIGIAMWMKMQKIYKDKTMNFHRKWIGWWNLLCPGTGAPDPLHHDTISFSTADIPRVQKMVEVMWESTPSLPILSLDQKGQVDSILEKVLQMLPRVDRPRRPRRRVLSQYPKPDTPSQDDREQESEQRRSQEHAPAPIPVLAAAAAAAMNLGQPVEEPDLFADLQGFNFDLDYAFADDETITATLNKFESPILPG